LDAVVGVGDKGVNRRGLSAVGKRSGVPARRDLAGGHPGRDRRASRGSGGAGVDARTRHGLTLSEPTRMSCHGAKPSEVECTVNAWKRSGRQYLQALSDW